MEGGHVIACSGCFLVKACSGDLYLPPPHLPPATVFPATCLKQLHMGEHPWWTRRGRRHLSLCASRQHVTEPLSPGSSVNPVVMFRSPHLLSVIDKYLIFPGYSVACIKDETHLCFCCNMLRCLMTGNSLSAGAGSLSEASAALPNQAVTLALRSVRHASKRVTWGRDSSAYWKVRIGSE